MDIDEIDWFVEEFESQQFYYRHDCEYNIHVDLIEEKISLYDKNIMIKSISTSPSSAGWLVKMIQTEVEKLLEVK